MRLSFNAVKQIIIIVSIRELAMDIELIKTFLEVKDCRHFGKAAENLYLTQAAVSTRVRQLERYFGVTLFHRARNNIQLTLAGERLIPHAESMLNTLRLAKQDVSLATEQVKDIATGTNSDNLFGIENVVGTKNNEIIKGSDIFGVDNDLDAE